MNHPPPSSLSLSLLSSTLYRYLPLRDSPNDQPQLELSLNPGDLIVVRGEMDEDGFYRGEVCIYYHIYTVISYTCNIVCSFSLFQTVDGQCGLVPSNYVERWEILSLLLYLIVSFLIYTIVYVIQCIGCLVIIYPSIYIERRENR